VDDSSEPIFRLEGGPGVTNMSFSKVSRIADSHDVVLVGYRGVEGSSVLDCPEVDSALKRSSDLVDDDSLRKFSEALASCAQRFKDDGVDLDGYTLPQRVDDLEDVRVALGYGRINLISESVGTRTAMIYSWRYPEAIHRSVMIAVNPPGRFLWDPVTTDEQIRYYADLCSQDEECSDQTDDLEASMRSTAADMPDRWFFLPIKGGNARLASFFGLFETTSEANPLSASMTLHSWRSAADGDSSGFWFVSFLADLAFPEAFVWGELAATAMLDAEVADDYYAAGGDPGSILGNPGTDLLFSGGGLVGAWPDSPDNSEYRRVRPSDVETLLIGGTVDLSTPSVNATTELLPSLPNGHQVVLAEFGHSMDFWDYQPEASTRLLNTFFETGEVDDSLYTHRTFDF
ncbi:MAG: alpha/beta hydrolase, partial [bacterium]|nr:alpha/beta hydrolase [bacterium]